MNRKKSIIIFYIASVLLLFIVSIGFSQKANFNYICPLPGSKYINPEQTIILKTGTEFNLSCKKYHNASITGSKSGNIDYEVFISNDNKTMVLLPKKPFSINETITVNIGDGLMTRSNIPISPKTLEFNTVTTNTKKLRKSFMENMEDKEFQAMITHPELKPESILTRDNNLPLDYPITYTDIYSENIGEEYYFLTFNTRAGVGNHNLYYTIVDKFGTPIFFRKTNVCFINFQNLEDGRLAIARNNKMNPDIERYFFMDSSYVVIDSVKTGNGYNMDAHDIITLENGNFILISYDPQPIDMSLIVPGGNPNAIVTGLVIQEVTPDEIVLFQWRSWDYFEITDATSDINLYAAAIDYVHCNAIAFDLDSNLVFSSRNLDEITKINFETGDIMYRFGLLSENNEFTIYNDNLGFSHQHDVNILPNGNMTIFDNGNLHSPQFSRAVEYEIDESNKTAELVWEFRKNPDVFAMFTGNVRKYPDNKKLIGWGSNMTVGATQLSTNDDIELEMYYEDNTVSYRTLKSYWRTNLFAAPESMNFGNYAGNGEPKYRIIPVTNTSETEIQISSAYLMTENFYVVSELPVQLAPGETVNLTFAFLPALTNVQSDVLTLNYDKFTLSCTERIARQVKLSAYWDENVPVVNFNPEFGDTGIYRDCFIDVYFSEPVRRIFGQAITSSNIPALFNLRKNNQYGEIVSFTGTISDDKMHITLYPDSLLDAEQQYYCELKSGIIENMQGNIIIQKETTVFTTGTIVNTNGKISENKISAYPSPFTSTLKVATNGNCLLQLINNNGQVVWKSHAINGITTINTSHLPSGNYIIFALDNNGHYLSKKTVVKSNVNITNN